MRHAENTYTKFRHAICEARVAIEFPATPSSLKTRFRDSIWGFDPIYGAVVSKSS